jgi:hypothetical protein
VAGWHFPTSGVRTANVQLTSSGVEDVRTVFWLH